MRILYHHRIRSKDGQFVHIEELTRALDRLGHEIVMVGLPAVEKEEFGADAGLVGWLKRFMPRFLYELLEFGYAFVDYRRLKRAAARSKPDCIYERYSLFLPTGVWLKRRLGLPMLLEVNAPLLAERARYDGIALARLARWTEQRTWRGADVVLPVTGVLAGHVERAGVPRSRIEVVPNGVDRERFNGAVSLGEAKGALGLSGRLVLGFTGFVREWHGLERVIDLLADYRGREKPHLLLVGDGPARGFLEQRARERGVADSFTVTGIVDRNDVARYIAAFDVALQPAVVDYASPLKLFEYLAMGRPVIAPATANIREILNDGENALLFDPASETAFRDGVRRLCDDAALRARLGQAGARTIVDRGLTWEANARRVVALFEKLGVTP